MDVNLFNFSFEHSMTKIRSLAGNEVALIGNLPPRDVLASKTPDEVRTETRKMVLEFGDTDRVIWSCGGGMPPNVTTENIMAFKETIDEVVPMIS
jgi:uroporphyrinogen decarboxylase